MNYLLLLYLHQCVTLRFAENKKKIYTNVRIKYNHKDTRIHLRKKKNGNINSFDKKEGGENNIVTRNTHLRCTFYQTRRRIGGHDEKKLKSNFSSFHSNYRMNQFEE